MSRAQTVAAVTVTVTNFMNHVTNTKKAYEVTPYRPLGYKGFLPYTSFFPYLERRVFLNGG